MLPAAFRVVHGLPAEKQVRILLVKGNAQEPVQQPPVRLRCFHHSCQFRHADSGRLGEAALVLHADPLVQDAGQRQRNAQQGFREADYAFRQRQQRPGHCPGHFLAETEGIHIADLIFPVPAGTAGNLFDF